MENCGILIIDGIDSRLENADKFFAAVPGDDSVICCGFLCELLSEYIISQCFFESCYIIVNPVISGIGRRKMRIRIINENDWEKSYDLDQSIIRIGSQVSCNIQLRDTSVPPLLMQIIRVNDAEIRNIMRFFAPNIMIIRGEQSFPADTNNPYEVFDGDQFNFGKYRMFISLGNDKTRIRTSPHISAEMFISKRELTPESTINGVLELKNLGTEKPCQFRMQISGIPNECVQFSPLPYLYPGASSSVGFIISHLLTKPDPGFTTVSIKISAPDEYFGEELEFNQDIYVAPVFDIVFDLEDDSKDLAGFNKGESPQAKLPEKQAPSLLSIPDTSRLDSSAEVEASAEQKAAPVRIVSAKDTSKNPFDENVNEESTPYSRKKTKEPVVVIRGGKDDAFDGENKEPASNKAAKPEPVAPQRPVRTSKSRVKKSDVKLTPSEKAAAAEFTEKLERNEKARTAPFEVVNEEEERKPEENAAERNLLHDETIKVVSSKQAAESWGPVEEEKPAEVSQLPQEENTVEEKQQKDENVKVVSEEQPFEDWKPAAEEKLAEPQQPRQEEKPVEDDLLSDGNAKVVPAKQAAQKRKPAAEEKPAEPQQPRQEEKPIEDDLLSDGNAKVVPAKQAAQKRKPVAEEKPAEPQQSRQEEKTIEDDLLSDGNAKVVPVKQAAWEEKPAETQQPAQNEKPAGESGAIGKNDTEDKASAEPAAENKSNSEEESAAMPLMLSEEKQVKRQRKKRVSPAVEKAEKPAEPVPTLPAHDMFRDNAGDEAEHLEHNFANKFRPGGDTPVVVVSGGGFDDAGFDENSETHDTGEPSGTQEGNKPQIRVVKGDTFDG